MFFYACVSTTSSEKQEKYNNNESVIDILEKCKKNILVASPDALNNNIDMLSKSEAGLTETGTEYFYISYQLLLSIYPVTLGDTEEIKLTGSIYTDIFSAIKNGKMPKVAQNDMSFLTTLLLPVAVLYSDEKSVENAAIEYINQIIKMNDKSVLPLYLRGFIKERNAQYEDALEDYLKALELAPSCYTAEMGLARIYTKTGKVDSALEIINLLTAQYPYSTEILRTSAEIHFQESDYKKALDITSEILRIEPDKPEILLLRAQIFLKEGNIQQASRLVDVLERENWENPQYILVKSSIQRQNKNFIKALETLEIGLKKYSDNKSIEQAYGAVLMQVGRKDEARYILNGTKPDDTADSESLIMLIDDAIALEDWEKASNLSIKLMSQDSSLQAGQKAWSVWHIQKKNKEALDIANKLYKEYSSDFATTEIYIKSLIALFMLPQAVEVIDERLSIEEEPENRSKLFFLKSETYTSDEQKLQLLRSALFEDLKNIDALLSIANLYKKMGDNRKAYRYLKQSTILSPENNELAKELKQLEEILK